MLRKLGCILLCMAMAFTLCFCGARDEVKQDEKKEIENKTEIENKEEKVKEDKNGFYDIELDIKPLDETEAETLSESAGALGFENEKLFHAFANAIGKKPSEVTAEDVDKVHYIAVGREGETGFSVYVGYVDYVDLCFSEKRDEPNFASLLSKALMMSELKYDVENDSLYDLGNFRNIEMFEIYDVKIKDVSFIKNYNKLIYGFFKSNGISDVSSLSDYNPETLRELDFTGNDIEDFSPLSHIEDKVVVMFDIDSGFKLTLDSYLEQKENPIEVPDTSDKKTENGEKKDAKDELVIVDKDGNPADFDSLFE